MNLGKQLAFGVQNANALIVAPAAFDERAVMMSGMMGGKPEDARAELTGHAHRVGVQSAHGLVERNSAEERNSRDHAAREACQGCGHLLVALTSHRRLPAALAISPTCATS